MLIMAGNVLSKRLETCLDQRLPSSAANLSRQTSQTTGVSAVANVLSRIGACSCPRIVAACNGKVDQIRSQTQSEGNEWKRTLERAVTLSERLLSSCTVT